ncbi:MAG: type II toxin-antitoxin system RelE/ParE family toxin [Chloroflexota bacterium]|nr:type II toxin-antitoxin system RelE/ParE family toxin [Chloroflexota bacterium]
MKLEFARQANREFDRLAVSIQRRLRPRIDQLSEDPLPSGALKLSGHESYYRIRVGDYRVIYEIDHEQGIVIVVSVQHRSRAYRRLR